MPLLRSTSSACLNDIKRRCLRNVYTTAYDSHVNVPAQPTETSEDGFRTFRSRQHGKPSLPLPPLMDPLYIARKEKHHRRKADTLEEKPTGFQERLANNVYARALAADVRFCAFSRARLPSHFLLPLRAVTTESENGPGEPALIPQIEPSRPKTPHCASRAHVFHHETVLRLIDKAPRKYAPQLLSQRMKQWYANLDHVSLHSKKAAEAGWKWEADTTDAILQKQRADVVTAILELPQESIMRGDLPGADVYALQERTLCYVHLTYPEEDPFVVTQKAPKLAPEFLLHTLLDRESLQQIRDGLSTTGYFAILGREESWRVTLAIDKLRVFLSPRQDGG